MEPRLPTKRRGKGGKTIGTKKILIVDDEENIRSVLKGMLEKDYDILEAGDGSEAVNIACSQKPDLIFMDILMPGTDGYTACNKIKEASATRQIPVVMLTAIGHQLNRELARKVGADDYITKPFKKEGLIDAVKRFLK